MPFDSVVIDERTLSRGSEAQQTEWEALVRELLAGHQPDPSPQAALHISVTEQHFQLDVQDSNGTVLHTKTIPHKILSEHINEYVDIVRQIAIAEGLNQVEALDMAKKVTHDRVARVLKKELRDFGLNKETSRRLFSLLLSLRIDTTKLVGIHGHRPIR